VVLQAVGHVGDLVRLANPAVAVLTQHASLHRDLAGPVLGVDDEHAGPPVDDVVDVGVRGSRPADVIDDAVADCREPLQGLGDKLLPDGAGLELPGPLLEPFGSSAEVIGTDQGALCLGLGCRTGAHELPVRRCLRLPFGGRRCVLEQCRPPVVGRHGWRFPWAPSETAAAFQPAPDRWRVLFDPVPDR
jgi:hypothetical protein